MEILEEMGIPDHLTWLLRNLYAGQEATVRTRHGTTDWFQIGEGGGRGVQDGEHVNTRGRCMLMYGKTNTIL